MKLHLESRDMCEWSGLGDLREGLRAKLARGESGKVSPFLLLAMSGVSAGEQRDCSELWMRDRQAACADDRAALAFTFDPAARPKIRIGYLSCDFHEHATSLLLVEMLEAHDRARFELFAYSYGADDGKSMRPRLEAAFDHFINIEPLSNIDAARAIHANGIDVLIDLKGYTQHTRTAILMFGPAPVQVNFLGYPGTLGTTMCDYIVTDGFLTPAASAKDYSESFAYLPHSYQPHGRKGLIGKAPTRADVGLPESGFVFCCFNQAYKITPEIFDVWCRLLLEAPDSVLWLLKNDKAEGNLKNEAFSRGVTADRLVFAEDLPQIDHLGRLQLADLVLDTSPYNAHTTASDALWASVPLVTCSGDTFPSRVAGSILSAIGLSELIATDLDAYFDLAYEFATNPTRLATVKAKLAANRLTTPLFDIEAYTRDIEGLYEIMWRRYRDGEAPASIGAVPIAG
ncbi:UDP-N-acetylglucosamine-peptide N-acetylglucosaminyltransferase [Methylocapsa polymorpha]|uniref:UDP-N-acetylglucosamine-peptide N-acetylglucosaminyltransferase n=1 Tax=Methylocapsa polymorpha TaxID=3080828 RepID=A0ABZ0HTY2_9HYPH|nr:UDP-N-acetylglucosamine-peptide N-acetylglucosaminyltransferase [Methylocapsa sp. RX1]